MGRRHAEHRLEHRPDPVDVVRRRVRRPRPRRHADLDDGARPGGHHRRLAGPGPGAVDGGHHGRDHGLRGRVHRHRHVRLRGRAANPRAGALPAGGRGPPRQIRRMVLAESALIGAAAAAVGCAGGCLGASILNRWMIAHEVAPAWFRIDVNPVALVIAFLLSVAAALIGAATVVWRASRGRPAAALRGGAATRRGRAPLRWVLGLGLLAAAVITGYAIAKSTPEYV